MEVVFFPYKYQTSDDILRELKFHFNIIAVSKTTITDYILYFNQNIP